MCVSYVNVKVQHTQSLSTQDRTNEQASINEGRTLYLYMKGCTTFECGTTHFIHARPTFCFTYGHFTFGWAWDIYPNTIRLFLEQPLLCLRKEGSIWSLNKSSWSTSRCEVNSSAYAWRYTIVVHAGQTKDLMLSCWFYAIHIIGHPQEHEKPSGKESCLAPQIE